MHSSHDIVDALVVEQMPAWAEDLVRRRARVRADRAVFAQRRRAGLQRRHSTKLLVTKEPTMKNTSSETTISGGGNLAFTGRPSRANDAWTTEEVQRIRDARDDGTTYTDLAQALQRSPRAVWQRAYRLRQEGRAFYRCGTCQDVKTAASFVSSMRFEGGRCRSCQHEHRTEPTTKAWESANDWVESYLAGRGGHAPSSEVKEAGLNAGHDEWLLGTALRRNPRLASRPGPGRTTIWSLLD